MSDAPLFTEKLIGFRGWHAVYLPEGVGLDHPEAIHLAQEIEVRKLREEALANRIKELKRELQIKDEVIARLGAGGYTRYGNSTRGTPYGGSGYSNGGYFGVGTAMMYHAPPPPIENLQSQKPLDPGLWTGDHSYWRPGRPTRARCRANYYSGGRVAYPTAHAAPDPDCTCGLHAQYEPGGRTSVGVYTEPQRGWVVGAVAAWGHIEAHRDVFRAEYMQPVVLAVDPDAPPSLERETRALAALYDIEAVELQDLGEAALQFGTPIPKEYRGCPKPQPQSPDEMKIPRLDLRLQSI